MKIEYFLSKVTHEYLVFIEQIVRKNLCNRTYILNDVDSSVALKDVGNEPKWAYLMINDNQNTISLMDNGRRFMKFMEMPFQIKVVAIEGF